MPQLIQLPDGAWIAPNEVTAIVPLDRQHVGFARIVIRTVNGGAHILEADDMEAAKAGASEWANKINKALKQS
jgi:hypothetical protein